MRIWGIILGLSVASISGAHASFSTFVEDLKKEATIKGLDPKIVENAFKDIEEPKPVRKAIKKSKAQPEFTFTFNKYVTSMHSNTRINRGIEKLSEHAQTFNKSEEKYGVPREVVTALWGVESLYGKSMGKFEILPSLATLAYQSHRKSFFRKEFFHAVRIVQDGHISLDNFTGSWAGAMGQCQFMPSSFHDYAADGNGDGKKDIWTTSEDVIASASNYLHRRGWQKGEKWGQRVVLTKYLPGDLKLNKHKLSKPKTIAEWQKLGLIPTTSNPFPHKNTQAKLFMPEGPSKKAYLVYKNFDVILSWNYSSVFAFSVLSLADKFKEAEGA